MGYELRNGIDEKTANILNGVANTELPIIITGPFLSGKVNIARFFEGEHSYGFLDGSTKNLDLEHRINSTVQTINTLMGENEGKVVVAMDRYSNKIGEAIGAHIHIKTSIDAKDINKRNIEIMPVL